MKMKEKLPPTIKKLPNGVYQGVDVLTTGLKRNLQLKYNFYSLYNYTQCLEFLADVTNNFDYWIDERYSELYYFEDIYKKKLHLKVYSINPKYKYSKKEVKTVTFMVYDESGTFVSTHTIFFKLRKWDYNYYE